MANENDFRDNLLDAEPLNVERQRQFQDALSRIMEPQLPRSHRWYYGLALAGAAVGTLGAVMGLVIDEEHRQLHAAVLVAWLASGAMSAFTLRRNAEPFQMMQRMSKAMVAVTFLGVGVLVFLGLQSPSVTNVLWVLFGIVVFLLASFINLWNRMLFTERALREQLLRVEYRLSLQYGERRGNST